MLLSLTILLFIGVLLWFIGVPCLFVYLYNRDKNRWWGLYYSPFVAGWTILWGLLIVVFVGCAAITGYIHP